MHTAGCASTERRPLSFRPSVSEWRNLQNILWPDRRIRAILDLQEHRAGFHRHQIVPLPRRDVNERPARDHVDGLRHPPLGVVEVFHEMPPQAHHRLRRRPVPMDGQHRPRLDRIQHPLRLVRRRIPQVQIHPEPRRGLRPGGQGVKGLFVDDHKSLSFRAKSRNLPLCHFECQQR